MAKHLRLMITDDHFTIVVIAHCSRFFFFLISILHRNGFFFFFSSLMISHKIIKGLQVLGNGGRSSPRRGSWTPATMKYRTLIPQLTCPGCALKSSDFFLFYR